MSQFHPELLPDWFRATGTDEQQDVLYTLMHGSEDNIVVEALAGCGKTTLLKLILNVLPDHTPTLFTAFSREVVETFKQSKPTTKADLSIQGIHSLGLKAIRKNLYVHILRNRMTTDKDIAQEILDSAFSGTFVDKDKYNKILNDSWPEYQRIFFENYAGDRNDPPDMLEVKRTIKKLVDLGRLYCATQVSELTALANRLGLIIRGEGEHSEIVKAREVILDGLGRSDIRALKTIDYTDMLWFPYAMDRLGAYRRDKHNDSYHIWDFPRYDYVLVDECQDLSVIQLDLIQKLRPRRMISVGDPNQAIFGFAGSDYASFKSIQDLPGTVTLPLTVNFRSTRSIGDEVRKLVPTFQTAAICEEGEDVKASSYEDIQRGDCIIARNNKPLIEIYFMLLRLSMTQRSLPAYIKGNIFDASDKAIAAEASDRCGSKLTESVIRELREMIKERVELLGKRGVDPEEAAQADYCKQVDMLIETLEVIHMMEPTKGAVYTRAFKIAQDLSAETASEGVCLCTAHRSKGLEFDRVHIYQKDDFMRESKGSTSEQDRQEKNLYYVALSRAKKRLMFLRPINEWDIEDVKEDEAKTFKKYGDNLNDVI